MVNRYPYCFHSEQFMSSRGRLQSLQNIIPLMLNEDESERINILELSLYLNTQHNILIKEVPHGTATIDLHGWNQTLQIHSDFHHGRLNGHTTFTFNGQCLQQEYSLNINHRFLTPINSPLPTGSYTFTQDVDTNIIFGYYSTIEDQSCYIIDLSHLNVDNYHILDEILPKLNLKLTNITYVSNKLNYTGALHLGSLNMNYVEIRFQSMQSDYPTPPLQPPSSCFLWLMRLFSPQRQQQRVYLTSDDDECLSTVVHSVLVNLSLQHLLEISLDHGGLSSLALSRLEDLSQVTRLSQLNLCGSGVNPFQLEKVVKLYFIYSQILISQSMTYIKYLNLSHLPRVGDCTIKRIIESENLN